MTKRYEVTDAGGYFDVDIVDGGCVAVFRKDIPDAERRARELCAELNREEEARSQHVYTLTRDESDAIRDHITSHGRMWKSVLVIEPQHKDACTGDAGKYQSGRAIEMQWLIRRICEEARRCDSVIDALCMAKRSADNACVRWPEDHRWLTDIAVEVIRDRETMATQHKDAHRMDAGENR